MGREWESVSDPSSGYGGWDYAKRNPSVWTEWKCAGIFWYADYYQKSVWHGSRRRQCADSPLQDRRTERIPDHMGGSGEKFRRGRLPVGFRGSFESSVLYAQGWYRSVRGPEWGESTAHGQSVCADECGASSETAYGYGEEDEHTVDLPDGSRRRIYL